MHLHRDTRNCTICRGCVKSTLKLFVQEQSTMPVMACWCYTYTISVGSPVRARWACSGSFQFLNRTTLLTATRSGYSKPRMIKIVSLTSFLLKITMYIYIVFYILLKLLHLNVSFYHHVWQCSAHCYLNACSVRTMGYTYSLHYFNSSFI